MSSGALLKGPYWALRGPKGLLYVIDIYYLGNFEIIDIRSVQSGGIGNI